ncbi:MAG: GNAT family N-acetyltransferase [Caldilineaceae bacterium]
MRIIELNSTHASDAARLHIAGQPGTFLTSLGPDVLTVFYRALPQSPVGFGFAAVEAQKMVGFVSATTSTSRLFLELGIRRLPHFFPPLLRRFAERPQLILHCMQTLFYPWLQHGHPDDTTIAAELLSIMVEPTWRSQGIGAQLLQRLVDQCDARQFAALDVTVAADNAGARRFYARHHFSQLGTLQLYGRAMCSYRRLLTTIQP